MEKEKQKIFYISAQENSVLFYSLSFVLLLLKKIFLHMLSSFFSSLPFYLFVPFLFSFAFIVFFSVCVCLEFPRKMAKEKVKKQSTAKQNKAME